MKPITKSPVLARCPETWIAPERYVAGIETWICGWWLGAKFQSLPQEIRLEAFAEAVPDAVPVWVRERRGWWL